MLAIERMPLNMRALLLRALLQGLANRSQTSRVFVQRLVKSVRHNRVGRSKLLLTLGAHFGNDVLNRYIHLLLIAVEKRLMRDRELVDYTDPKDAGITCHGCMSYKCQLLCPTCKCPRFCIGCYDYGPCMECEACEQPSSVTP